jgi:hypothetical protein
MQWEVNTFDTQFPLPKCFDIPGVPSSGILYVNTSSAFEWYNVMAQRAVPKCVRKGIWYECVYFPVHKKLVRRVEI